MNGLNLYQIVFKNKDGVTCFSLGRANNVPYAIQDAKRRLAKAGCDVSGIEYVRHELMERAG